MKVTNSTFKQWIKERDEAVATLDVRKFKSFYQKWQMQGVYERSLPNNDKVIEISMYKCAVNITTMPKEVHDKAAAWLTAHGYDLTV